MEPFTHMLTGACLARSGLNRSAAYATLTMVIAAELPDIDTLWSLDGPVAGFAHHRGITHSFVGILFEATILVFLIWWMHLVRMRRRRVGGSASAVGSAATDAPVRWGVLWLLAVVALLSHIFLDWTNNYGVRPFLPFNPRWYAGSFVFIFEPVLFGLLLLGLLAPALFGLIGSEVGARSKTFRGAGWARFALLASVGLWGFRYVEHANAVGIARQQDQRNASGTRLPVDSVTASPYPVLPFRWHVVVDTPEYQRTYTLDTQLGTAVSDDQADLVYKPPVTPATRAAQQTPLGRVYLDWSPHALVRDMGVDVDGNTLVTFRDLRFAYDVSFLHGREETPLSGSVLLSPKLRLIESSMDGRTQHAGGGVER